MIRESVAAGLLYPEDPDTLHASIRSLLQSTTVERNDARAIISPNGKWKDTGPYCAAAMKAAASREPELIILIATPNDDIGPRILLPESDVFTTPIGPIPVATEVISDLADSSTRFVYDEIAHLGDDGIEVQLPYIRYLFAGVPIVPLFVGRIPEDLVRVAVTALELAARGRRTLYVASANLSTLTTPGLSDYQSRTVFHWLVSNDSTDLTGLLEELSEPPRSIGALSVVRYCCRRLSAPSLISRGIMETVGDNSAYRVEYGALAYYPADNETSQD